MAFLVLVAGPSQAGKNTLIAEFIAEHEHSARIPTATSRPIREGEEDGVDKFFIDQEQFEQRPSDFIEYVEEHGNYYGVLKEKFNQFIADNDVCFMDLDYRGIKSINKHVMTGDEAIGVLNVFLVPQEFSVLEERIRRRGDLNADVRIENARQEWNHKDDPVFDAVIDTSTSIEESYQSFKQAIESRIKAIKK